MLAFWGCGGPETVDPPPPPPPPPPSAPSLTVLGHGAVLDRFTGELWVHGDYAYTATIAVRAVGTVQNPGNAIKIWNVAGAVPVLVDSVIVPGAARLSDIQVSDDGKLLLASLDISPGSIVVYNLTNPTKPVLLSQFSNANMINGVHTAEVQRVNGVIYAFLSTSPGTIPSRLEIVDLSNPSAPVSVFSRPMGSPFIHDVFVRDGLLFTAIWNSGAEIFDIGGGGRGGTVANPVSMGIINTVGGRVHNIWWYHDRNGSKKYLFIGEEGPTTATTTSGDIHVVDITNMLLPREVAFFNVPNAGTHNFSMDEARGLLYAAYYNGGVRVLDMNGDLSACAENEKGSNGRCDLGKMKREVAVGLLNLGRPVSIWGVHFLNGSVYATDIGTGLYKMSQVP